MGPDDITRILQGLDRDGSRATELGPEDMERRMAEAFSQAPE